MVHAGGKVVLVGEYAVVDGAPAWVAAVDRGVTCEVSPATTVEIETPGDDRFVRAALTEVQAPPARYCFSDWRPVASDTKVGLGGSAAATVAAVVAAWGQAGGRGTPLEVHRTAHRVHAGVQGSGSGIDVAASAFGGVLSYAPRRGVLPGPDIVPTVVFTGQSASTGPRVSRYLAWADRQRFVDQSTALSDRFPSDPIGVMRQSRQLLQSMAVAAGIDYWTDAIGAVVASAEQHGGAAKPSGAGGGDIVVALFADIQARAAFLRDVSQLGFLHIPVSLAPAAHLRSSH